MPKNLKRYQQSKDLHLVTFSCDRRLPFLAETDAYAVFEESFERARSRYQVRVTGYVLMPEHVHLLLNEPEGLTLGTFIGIVKQTSSRKLKGARAAFWEERYHDVNIFNPRRAQNALKYLHRNPVARGLVQKPEEWRWSSFRHYLTGLPGTVEIESWWNEMARKRVTGLEPGSEAPEDL